MEKVKYPDVLQERKCSFIKEQRIIASTQHSGYDGRRRLLNQFEIDDIAAQLIKEFAKQQMEFASESQKIDSTFIKRLVEGTYNKYKEAEFQEKLSKLKAKINNYKEYGLMPQIDILEEYPEHLQNVLSLYIDDMEQKCLHLINSISNFPFLTVLSQAKSFQIRKSN